MLLRYAGHDVTCGPVGISPAANETGVSLCRWTRVNNHVVFLADEKPFLDNG